MLDALLNQGLWNLAFRAASRSCSSSSTIDVLIDDVVVGYPALNLWGERGPEKGRYGNRETALLLPTVPGGFP